MAKSRKRQPEPEQSEPTIMTLAESAWGQVEHMRKGVMRLHLWLMTIIGLAQPYAVGLFDHADGLPKEPWPFYWAVLQTTAPLTTGLVLWAVLIVACWPNDSEGGYLMTMGFVGGLILTVALQIGNWFGLRRVELIEPVQVLGPINALCNALISFLLAYRGALFISSLGIAVYAGYVTYRYIHGRADTTAETATAAERNDRRAA